jgi:hydrogenase-1 operon protein HyaF
VDADMATFRPPPLPQAADPSALCAVRAVLAQLIGALRAQPRGGSVLDLGGLDAATLTLLDQTLGEGEVSAIVRAPCAMRIQETAFAGIWRVRAEAAEGAPVERIETGAIPAAVPAAMRALTARTLPRPPAVEGLMNAPSLLTEIADHAARGDGEGHIINLALLPMTPQDLAWLAAALGEGPVRLLSRGYGNCRITGTRLANVWRVQYFNSMDVPILDTVEVTDVPAAALAAPEDLADSIGRLEEWLATLEAL